MDPTPRAFVRPGGLEPGAVVRALERVGPVRRSPPEVAARVVLDTFDSRLHRRGQVLEAVSGPSGERLVWRGPGGEPLGSLPAPAPRFAWDLPPGPFRKRLEAVTGIRALLPVVRLETRAERFAVVDDNGKTVCRVDWEDHAAAAPDGGAPVPLSPRLRVTPVRGYAKPFARVLARLRELGGLAGDGTDEVGEALAALDIRPGAYSSKVRVALERGMTADAAVRRVLLHLVGAMEANVPGTRGAWDTEFLHDFRVAVRRTRAALAQLKGVLPADGVARYRPEFAWLGQVTGPARDLDVYRLGLPGFQAALPPDLRDALGPFDRLLARKQAAAHREVARALGSRRFRRLVAGWRAFLEAPAEPGPDAPRAGTAVEDLARRRIAKAHRRVLREGAAIGPDSPADAFHELRKSCKKLRYLLEFFQGLFDPEGVGRLVKELKGLQDNLGAFQDLEVQAAALIGFAGELGGDDPARTHLALGVLVEHLRRRQIEVRDAFGRRFDRFADRVTRRRLDAVLRGPGG